MQTYVVATDQSCTVKQFVIEVYQMLGFTEVTWMGTNALDIKLYGRYNNQKVLLVEIDKDLYRPGEVPFLHGDTTKIREALGWTASISR